MTDKIKNEVKEEVKTNAELNDSVLDEISGGGGIHMPIRPKPRYLKRNSENKETNSLE